MRHSTAAFKVVALRPAVAGQSRPIHRD